MIKRKLAQAGTLLALLSIGSIVVINALPYEQTRCDYSPDDQYIWIHVHNGVHKQGVRFVSDGVIFDSSVIGMTYAKDYSDIPRVIYEKRKDDMGLLSIDVIDMDGHPYQEVIGYIDATCWQSVKKLLISNPLSQSIEQIDKTGLVPKI